MATLPSPLRAALGLAATLADAVVDGPGRPDKLPDRILELPVLAVSTALQISLRAQQRYAALMARGDEVLAQLRGGAPEEPPPWAQFDDETSPTSAHSGDSGDAGNPVVAAPVDEPAKKVPAKKVATKKATPVKAPAKKTTAAKLAAKTASAAKTTAVKAPAKKAPAKTVGLRPGQSSAFDRITEGGGDEWVGLPIAPETGGSEDGTGSPS